MDGKDGRDGKARSDGLMEVGGGLAAEVGRPGALGGGMGGAAAAVVNAMCC